ncbi:MAG: hypothetical protein Q9M28_06810 [Mariprofundaceae bacterium]|nr:hypothetical protein [Mariprofundaceae bacterium]
MNIEKIHTKLEALGSRLFWPVIWSCVAVIIVCGAIVWSLTH